MYFPYSMWIYILYNFSSDKFGSIWILFPRFWLFYDYVLCIISHKEFEDNYWSGVRWIIFHPRIVGGYILLVFIPFCIYFQINIFDGTFLSFVSGSFFKSFLWYFLITCCNDNLLVLNIWIYFLISFSRIIFGRRDCRHEDIFFK